MLWETADAYFKLGEYEKALELGNIIRELYPDRPNAGDWRINNVEKNVKQGR